MICFHCHLPLPLDVTYPVTIEGEEQLTCCPGCQAAISFVDALQLTAYYKFRTAPNLKVDTIGSFDQFDLLYQEEGVQEVALLVEGIQCAACCWLIEKILSLEPSIRKVSVDLASQKMMIQWDTTVSKLSALVTKIAQLGYRIAPYEACLQLEQLEQSKQQALLRLGWSALGMMQVMMFAVGVYIGEFQDMSSRYAYFMGLASAVVTLPILAMCGQPFFKGAWRSLYARQVAMDLPISIALISALWMSVYHLYVGNAIVYFDTICMFLFFLSLNRFFEISAKLKAILPIAHLHQNIERDAILATTGASISIDGLKMGDHILVPAGHMVPLDGKIVEGETSLSTPFLTGEMTPFIKKTGDAILAGAMNHEQPIVVEVTKEKGQSTLNAILELIENADQSKPKMVEWGNTLAQYFLLLILILAVISGLIWRQFDIFLSVLVVSCPCALSLALPLALTMAKNSLLKKGLLLKDTGSIDALLKIDTLIFDKTGTLTEGQFSVDAFEIYKKSESEVKSIVKSLEKYSEHPVGQALFRFCKDARGFQAQDIKIIPQQGIEGVIKGEYYKIQRGIDAFHRVTLEDTAGKIAAFTLSDSLRAGLEEEIQFFKQQGIQLMILSGDKKEAVEAVAKTLGIQICDSGLSPQDKLKIVKALQAQNHVVCMVGDGLNDGPALKQADLSFALNSGVQMSQISADGVVLTSDLKTMRQGWMAARVTRRTMMQNLSWAMVYNLIMLPLTAFGLLTPYWAAIGMSLSSFLVVWHSLRLDKRIGRL